MCGGDPRSLYFQLHDWTVVVTGHCGGAPAGAGSCVETRGSVHFLFIRDFNLGVSSAWTHMWELAVNIMLAIVEALVLQVSTGSIRSL